MPFRNSLFLKTHRLALTLLVVGVAVIGLYALLQYRSPDAVLRECATAENKPLCFSTRIEEMVRTRGIPAAFDALAIAYNNDPQFAGTCHAVTHDLGKAAYEEFHRTGKTELTSKASYCGYGYYHGFLDALLIDTNDLAEARSFCTYVGKNVPHPPPPEYAEGSCYHGVGHGITDGTDPRLWGNAVAIAKPGLALCKQVADGNETWLMRCVSGVFNAIGNMYPDPKYKLDSGTDPYALCRDGGFSDLDTLVCYNQMNTQAVALAHGDLHTMIAFIDAIKNRRYRSEALHEAVSYFVQVLKWSGKDLSVDEMNVCDTQPSDLKDTCVNGFIGGVFEFGSPGRQYIVASNVCSSETLDRDLKAACYSELISLSKYYYEKDVLRSVCENVPTEYRTVCAS